MAAMNGPQFVSCMLRRKDRLDFTSTLQDLRQWPTLGQSSESELKKKAAPFGNSSSNSTGKAASSSRLKGDSGSDRSSVKSNDANQTDSSGGSSHGQDEGVPVGEHVLQRRNSGGKKGGKKVWEKMPKEKFWPPSQLAMQDKMRRHESSYNRPDHENRFRPPGPVKQPSSNHSASSTLNPGGVKPPAPNATNNSAALQNGPNNAISVANQPFRNNGNAQADFNRRFKKPPAPPTTVGSNFHNRPRIARKLQGFRQRDMTFDGDYMGRDGDGHSDGADNESQHELGDSGYWPGYDGATTPDWSSSSMYYDYGVDGYAHGYLADNYSGYAYYVGVDGGQGGLDENGLYIPPSPMPTYALAPADNIELKEMIKYQIEYYFSPENLEKDFFLRRMMAQDGSVVLCLVATFQRVRALTQDFNLIIESIVDSERVELMDNFMVRPRHCPESWPIAQDLDKTTGYYYINGEMGHYTPSFDETDESGTGEEENLSYPDEDEEALENMSMDGSELSAELSDDVRRQMLSLKATSDPHHLEAAIHAMSEKFLQHVK